MTLDKALRNTLRNTVTQCRRLLEDAVGDVLEGRLGIGRDGQIEDAGRMGHLSLSEMEHREEVISHLRHIEVGGFKPADAVAQLIREVAYTHLNRLCAYKMLERRRLIREAVGRGLDSNGFKFYLVDHPEDEKLWTSGQQDVSYRHFLEWLGGTLSEEIGVLFSPTDPANRLFPPQRTLEAVLDLINAEELTEVWDEEETIGWVYQYYTPKELRDQARKESQAPRNSYELSFRNQFYTPDYVVHFLVDNTLGRTWYEMRQGNTRLTDQCAYLVRRPDEVFLDKDSSPEVSEAQRWLQGENVAEPDVVSLGHTVNGYSRTPAPGEGANEWVEERLPRLTNGDAGEFKTQELLDLLFLFCRKDQFAEGTLDDLADEIETLMDIVRERVDSGRRDELSQEERLRAPAFIPYRAPKDPRELRILDPACGSGHFLLYCFDLLETIYEEAYEDEHLGEALREEYPDREEFRRAVPALILRHNLHGIDIDVRATQIAALALWLRAQRAYGNLGLKGDQRPRITRSNIVCAEPMPGEGEMLEEFTESLEPTVLGQLVKVVFDKMKLAGEAGSLLKIEEEIEGVITQARAQWQREFERATDRRGNELLLTHSEMDRLSSGTNTQVGLFDISQITDEEFWAQAEGRVIEALRSYSAEAANGMSHQRELFADDATQGFAFIDICRKRFDVVLMNPPFGDPTGRTLPMIDKAFPVAKKNLYIAFVVAMLDRTVDNGLLGCVTDRTYVVQTRYEEFRFRYMLGSARSSLNCLVDHGWGVLDSYVQTASAVLEKNSTGSEIVCVDLKSTDDQASILGSSIRAFHDGEESKELFVHDRSSLAALPSKILAFWLAPAIVNAFGARPSIDPHLLEARSGMSSSQNERFYKVVWEVPREKIGAEARWSYLANGGDPSPFFRSQIYVIDFEDEGRVVKTLARELYGSETRTIKNQGYYRKPGLTYGKRTESFNTQILPAGQIFSNEGHSLFPLYLDDAWLAIGYLNSTLVSYILNSIAGLHKESGYVGSLPMPLLSEQDDRQLRQLAREGHDLISICSQRVPENQWFTSAFANHYSQEIGSEFDVGSHVTDADKKLSGICASIDDIIERSFGLDLEARENIGQRTWSIAKILYGSDQSENQTIRVDWIDKLGYCVGCIFGRWDVRISVDPSLSPKLSDPFASLPTCPPGMLVGPDGLPAKRDGIASEGWMRARPNATTLPPEDSARIPTISDAEYPLAVDWDGILVDDPEHEDDILRRVRDVLVLLWGERADEIEGEACDLLGVRDLRTYLRNPRQSFDHHIKRYSKSRRKAPIYWLLQSPKRNYGLWLYYHRLDPDILFKALHKYVEPKIRLEEGRLEEYEARRRSAGTAGREAKQAENAVAKQEELLVELREFRDRLERAARLHLRPDLNDGVVINIAPLHELVPWKEAKSKWNELLAGKYEWSSIGKQLRDKGMV